MPEFCLTNTSECPPSGYNYTEPSTGKKFSHYDWTAFTEAIRSHREGNNIPLSPEWREELKDLLCRENLIAWKAFCKRCDMPRGVARPFSIEAARSFVKFMGDWLAKGGGFASQEEADARSKVCAGCDFNTTQVGKCGSCWNAVLQLILNIVGGRKTIHNESIHSCSVCSCSLKVACWMPLEPQQNALDEGTKEKFRSLKSFCWKAQNL